MIAHTEDIDAQRFAVYSAESLVWWGERFPSLDEAQRYIDRVLRTSLWRKRTSVSRVSAVSPQMLGLDPARGAMHHKGHIIYMVLPPHALNERYVLHELAHVLGWRADEPHHGPSFARAYLLLVGAFMGIEVARTLRLCYASHGVEW